MALYSASQKKTAQFSPPRPIDEYGKDSIKKMAVLFTDIVGSSKFFQSRGDIAGRKMLGRHQDMASPAITKHGGFVVKFLGDSVMAYFFDAREALKSAIRIQQKFQQFNNKKDPEDQIHIRICIHFGDGIVEERDIFGDVVNMAAKFLLMANGDQILISQEVWDQVQGLSPIRLESIDISDKAHFPRGFAVYRVIWDETINLDPLMKNLVYFRPIWELGKNHLPRAWNRLLEMKDNLWPSEVQKEKILSDKSIALIVKKAPLCLAFAKNVIEFLKVNLGQDGVPFLPVQIIIDTGPYLRADKLVLEDLKVNWEEIELGEIYISGSAYNFMKNEGTFSTIPRPALKQPQSFFKFGLNEQQKDGSCLFLYQDALIQGENPPCFYCGDKRHLTLNCPSKKLTEMTQALSQLGYLTFSEINSLYFNYLTGAVPNVELGSESATESTQWAFYGFHELKSVYQLRFFRAIWNFRDENWDRIKERKGGGDKGGLFWIGLDCIRVSNLHQAGSILGDALKKNPQDYRAYCAMGFLNVEKNDFHQAKHYFKKALNHTFSTPQKIFILFLLSRLCDLANDPLKAEGSIRKIIQLNPYCSEALYQDILFQFRKGREAVALHKLIKLIKKSREYYINALIDPELVNFNKLIFPKLKILLDEAGDEANNVAPKAKEELKRLKRWLDKDEKEVVEAQTLWLKIEKLSETDSYFGYLDVSHYGNFIINTGRTRIGERKRQLTQATQDLTHRLEEDLFYVNNFPYPYLVDNLHHDLQQIYIRLNKNFDMDEPKAAGKFKDALNLTKELSSEIDQIELKLQRLGIIRWLLQFISKFFKKSLLFQAANLLIALIVFPIIVYYLNFLVPQIRITPQNIWFYQKGVLVLGGISGLLLAFLTTTKSMPKG